MAQIRSWAGLDVHARSVLAVTVDANPKLVAPFVERHGFTFSVGLDAKMELAHTYGVRALPSSFVIDRDGRPLNFLQGRPPHASEPAGLQRLNHAQRFFD